MLASALLLASAVSILKSLMFAVFMFVGILMCLIVLLQEPKGGGLSGAFGGVGAETFGVQTGGVNKFTSWLAAIFLSLAIAYAAMREPELESLNTKSLTEQTPPAEGIGSDGDGSDGDASDGGDGSEDDESDSDE